MFIKQTFEFEAFIFILIKIPLMFNESLDIVIGLKVA